MPLLICAFLTPSMPRHVISIVVAAAIACCHALLFFGAALFRAPWRFMRRAAEPLFTPCYCLHDTPHMMPLILMPLPLLLDTLDAALL